jgi:3-methyladenine DNA glycosylase AlkD
MTTVDAILADLKKMGSQKNRDGMARFGIKTDKAFGVSVTVLRQYGKKHRHDHALALALWQTGIHEAQMLAAIIDDPAQVTPDQMDDWVKDFDSWDVTDTTCTGLFDKTPFAVEKAIEWCTREPEFEKRAGFALMTGVAWHSKTKSDQTFLDFLPIIKRESHDDRNFVRKAVNWCLRTIGKRNAALNKAALATAEQIKATNSKAGRWIASDAIRELSGYLKFKPTQKS